MKILSIKYNVSFFTFENKREKIAPRRIKDILLFVRRYKPKDGPLDARQSNVDLQKRITHPSESNPTTSYHNGQW